MALVALAAVTMALLSAACGEVDDASDSGGATPTANDERTIVPAPIDDLELIVRESAPPQYAVRVVSGLPSGCAQFNEAKITSRAGTTIQIEVTNTIPSGTDVICTAIYGTHEEIIDLGSDFDAGREYVVKVNDEEMKFTAQ
jgi:hypothetical protein